MNTRSTARFVGLAMAAALAMSGCGGGSSKPADPAPADPAPADPAPADPAPADPAPADPAPADPAPADPAPADPAPADPAPADPAPADPAPADPAPADPAPADPAPADPAPADPAPVQPRGQSSTRLYTFDFALRDVAQRRHIRAAVAAAAGNTPNSGSVTQSSTGDGATTDSVSVMVERGADGTVSWTVQEAAGKWSVDKDSARVLAEPDGVGWKGIEFHQAPGGGPGNGTGPGLYVDVYTDIEAPTTRCGVGDTLTADDPCTYEWPDGRRGTLRIVGTAVQFGGVHAGTDIGGITEGGSGTSRRIVGLPEGVTVVGGAHRPDADYLAGGIWVRVPTNAASVADYEFGAFVDGNDPFEQANLAGLEGTATYTGEATAVYSHQGNNRNYFVDADVSLTADFGDASSLGSISGTVSNVTGEGPEANAYDGVSVSLGTARIGDADSGFFTGDTSTSGTDSTFTGKWGGQFYGNGAAASDHPGSVAGTFGAATADGSESFVGVYGAQRREEQ